MSEIEELLERFRRGPELVAVAMIGAAGSEVDYVPAPGAWSVRQIMAHLADSEMVGADRFRRVIAEDNPTLMVYDQDAWAAKLDYARRKPSHSMETFRRTRADNYELLKGLPEEAFARIGTHSERGKMMLLDVVRMYADHAEGHANQLRKTRAAFKSAKAAAPGH
ncbi:MAG: DinB family protein [Acidobacteriales bacterium]|nr:DinB family protein [Terriglobales bacterium]